MSNLLSKTPIEKRRKRKARERKAFFGSRQPQIVKPLTLNVEGETARRQMGRPFITRNSRCPCRSGKRFKNCHRQMWLAEPPTPDELAAVEAATIYERAGGAPARIDREQAWADAQAELNGSVWAAVIVVLLLLIAAGGLALVLVSRFAPLRLVAAPCAKELRPTGTAAEF